MKCYWFILTLNSFARIMDAFDKNVLSAYVLYIYIIEHFGEH